MPDDVQLQIVNGLTNAAPWPDSLAERFARSLKVHSSETARPRSLETLIGSIVGVAEKIEGRTLDHQFLTIAARALLIQAAETSVTSIISRCAQVCESPLELGLAFAIYFVARQRGWSVVFDFGDCIMGDAQGGTTLVIKLQAPIDGLRIDLLLNLITAENGVEGETSNLKQLVIEADGAEFHERTHEQALRDRRRDRRLQALGFSVFRFTGAEVWRDMFACAREATSFLKSSLDREVAPRKPATAQNNGGSQARAASLTRDAATR